MMICMFELWEPQVSGGVSRDCFLPSIIDVVFRGLERDPFCPRTPRPDFEAAPGHIKIDIAGRV